MPNQKKQKVEGELADGSFDISDVPDSAEDLEGAIAEVFGDGGPEEAHEAEATEDAGPTEDAGAVEPAAPVEPTERYVGSDEEFNRLLAERDEAIEARKRAMADFVNYRRRADENEVRAQQQGVANVVRSLMPMLDHLDLALGQQETEMTTDQLFEGVRMVHDELAKALETNMVRVIDPETGSEFDPNEHQAVTRECTDEYPPNSIAAVFQVGYAVNDMILRPATVSVTAPADGGEE